MRCFKKSYLGSRPQSERGALGSVVIAGGVKTSCKRFGFQEPKHGKGASEDRLTLVDLLEADTGVPRDCLPAAMDDRVGWRKRAMGGEGAGGVRGVGVGVGGRLRSA